MSLIFIDWKNIKISYHARDRLKERKIDIERAFLGVSSIKQNSSEEDANRWRREHGPLRAPPSYYMPTYVYEGEYSSANAPNGFVRYKLVVADNGKRKKLVTAYLLTSEVFW